MMKKQILKVPTSAIALAALTIGLLPASGEILTFTIDSSPLTATSTTSAFTQPPQSAGVSDVTRWSGFVRVEFDDFNSPTRVRIVNGSISSANSGSWDPGSGGTGPAALAAYGFRGLASVRAGGFVLTTVAYRNLVTVLSMPNSVPLFASNTGSTFQVSGGSPLVNENNGSFDYDQAGYAPNRHPIESTPASYSSAIDGTYTRTPQAATFTFPITLGLKSRAAANSLYSIYLTGTLTARLSFPAPAPSLTILGGNRLTTSRSRLTLRCKSANAEVVEFKNGRGGFWPVRGSISNWKIPLQLDAKRTVVRIRAIASDGKSTEVVAKVTRK